MSPRQKQSTSLIMHFMCILLFVVIFYWIFNWCSNKTMQCGCGSGCQGMNVSCPCYRRRMISNRNEYYSPQQNEYYTPQQGTDFTSYLDKVRQNQLAFQRENRENYSEYATAATINEMKNQVKQQNVKNQYTNQESKQTIRNQMQSQNITNPYEILMKSNKRK